jgi:2-iminobutanoate/2-iminopropanoate deaminase
MSPPHLARWTEARGFVFVSGQLPFDAARQIVGDAIAPQTAQALENLEAALREAGLDRSHVVKVTVWLAAKSDFAGFNDAYAAFFGAHRPARSTVVSELLAPNALVEIEAVAARPT